MMLVGQDSALSWVSSNVVISNGYRRRDPGFLVCGESYLRPSGVVQARVVVYLLFYDDVGQSLLH
jgi:hypothetical protein